MAEIIRRYTTDSERLADVRDLEARGYRMLHNHHIYKNVRGADGETHQEWAYGEQTFTDAPDVPDPNAIDWRALRRAAVTDSDKIALLLKRAGLE